MPVEPHEIFDGSNLAIGQWKVGTRWELLGATDLQTIGELKPLEAKSIEANTQGNIKRQLAGVHITAYDLIDVNPYTDLVRVWYRLGDGSEYPCGVFCFSSLPRHESSFIPTISATMLDQGFHVDVESSRTFSIAAGGRVLDLIDEVLDSCAIPRDHRILPESSDAHVMDPVAWPAGTSKTRIIGECCKLAGWLPLYFDNRGNAVIRVPPNIDYDAPDVTFRSEQSRLIADSIVRNENLLTAPNRFVVIGNGPSIGEIVAYADVDERLPYSIANRGRERCQVHKIQGLGSTGQAQQIAETLAAAAAGYENLQFASTPDPRHDLFFLVEYDFKVFRELQFSLPLRADDSAGMKHQLTLGGFPAAG